MGNRDQELLSVFKVVEQVKNDETVSRKELELTILQQAIIIARFQTALYGYEAEARRIKSPYLIMLSERLRKEYILDSSHSLSVLSKELLERNIEKERVINERIDDIRETVLEIIKK